MTQTPDEPDDRDESGATPGDPSAGRKLDEDAAWRDIVAHYGDRPTLDDPEPRPPTPPDPAPQDIAERERRLTDLFRPGWSDPVESEATWDDEGHFVPPSPPPVTVTDPRRRAAWAGLFGAPLIMLVAVVFGWGLPGWLLFGLSAAFVGGFAYLVATMPHRRHDGPDDGAVV